MYFLMPFKKLGRLKIEQDWGRSNGLSIKFYNRDFLSSDVVIRKRQVSNLLVQPRFEEANSPNVESKSKIQELSSVGTQYI